MPGYIEVCYKIEDYGPGIFGGGDAMTVDEFVTGASCMDSDRCLA
ncbi:MAG: hypothetical protein ACP5MB_04355 [bacterium]